jgi:hypothetical protein
MPSQNKETNLTTFIMKTKQTILLLSLMIMLLPTLSKSQNIQHSGRSLKPFNSLIIGGYYKVNLHHDSLPHIIINAKESDIEKINTEVRNGVLQISNKPIRQNKAIILDLYNTDIEDYDISGAVILISDEVQKPQNLHLDISGAAMIDLIVDTKDITAALSGASVVHIKGKAQSINAKASGASILKTDDLEVENSRISVSGAARIQLETNDSNTQIREEKEVDVNRDNEIQASDKDGERTTYGVTYDGSTARAKFLGIKIHVDEDDETADVKVGTHEWVYDSDGEVTHKRIKYDRFNGHWGGFGMGINGYVNDKLSYELPKEYEFMNLLWQKSINVDMNIYEQNISLSSKQNIGLITGIGYSIYNYRFSKSFTVMQDSNYFSALYNKGINVRKSKIVTNFITVPLIFEIQDQNPSPLTKYRWHVSLGAIFGLRVHTHQKTYFDETNKDFDLASPISGEVVAQASSPSYPKVKVHDDFYMRPFKMDASLRAGWGWINLYANLSMTEMFSKNKGPKLYPFTIGVMLTSW